MSSGIHGVQGNGTICMIFYIFDVLVHDAALQGGWHACMAHTVIVEHACSAVRHVRG